MGRGVHEMSDQSSAILETEIDYPESDGRPMAETPLHRDLMFLVIEMLRLWFAKNPMVYISGNMFWYYERGNPPPPRLAGRAGDARNTETARTPRLPDMDRGQGTGRCVRTDIALDATRRPRNEVRTLSPARRGRVLPLRSGGRLSRPVDAGIRFATGNTSPSRSSKTDSPAKFLACTSSETTSCFGSAIQRPASPLPFPAELLAQTDKELRDEILAREKAEAEVERLRRELEALRRGSPPTS